MEKMDLKGPQIGYMNRNEFDTPYNRPTIAYLAAMNLMGLISPGIDFMGCKGHDGGP